jgi:uncharacterized protein (DUF58 family)
MKTSSSTTPTPSKSVFTLKSRNRTLQITREGAGFIVLIFAVGIGAIYSGSNLLYLILAMCLSFLMVSGVISELVLKKIIVMSFSPSTAYAGDHFSIPINIANEKKYLSSYSLRITLIPNDASRLEGNTGVYLFHLPPGSVEDKTLLVKATQRGSLRIKGFQIATSFPFGFFFKTKFLPALDEIIIFPSIQPVRLPLPSGPSTEEQGIVRHQGEEIVALKEYSEGDPMNAVHWKSSAKTGNLRVKEFHTDADQCFTLFLNLHNSQTNRQVADPVLEKRVSEAASLAYKLIRNGNEVSLKTENNYQIPFGNTEPHLERIMRFLALVGLKEKED